ncbi:PTS sugar transporter subunit IIA [Desulfovibrio sp. OttesenSCG-928-C06]|nr:PTS sugar transporter subunit IIA [Desulfovibrio sp. OttesenSCG-928-C06]
MALADFLKNGGIIADMGASSKQEALIELVDALNCGCPGLDRGSVMQVLLQREALGSTGLGDGVAIPHGKDASVLETRVVIGRSIKGCDFAAVDGKACHIFCLIVAPQDPSSGIFGVLGHAARIFRSAEFRKRFMEAGDAEEIRRILNSVWRD